MSPGNRRDFLLGAGFSRSHNYGLIIPLYCEINFIALYLYHFIIILFQPSLS